MHPLSMLAHVDKPLSPMVLKLIGNANDTVWRTRELLTGAEEPLTAVKIA
jgi:hypothetical protein